MVFLVPGIAYGSFYPQIFYNKQAKVAFILCLEVLVNFLQRSCGHVEVREKLLWRSCFAVGYTKIIFISKNL